jgi:S-adenosylmethionine synthetase
MEIRLAYVIGRADPTDVTIDTFGTCVANEERLERVVREIFPLKPREMIRHLKLRNPIYLPTASYGHFGRKPATIPAAGRGRGIELFTWEKLDMVDELRRALK